MIFKSAKVTNISTNVIKGEIKISFSVKIDELNAAEELAGYADKDAGRLTLDIYPHQVSMFAKREAERLEKVIDDTFGKDKVAVEFQD